jgi:hypothetical protein
MKNKNVYELSYKYSPPKINLRDAKIMDDYGDDSYAKREIKHIVPDDVLREDFEYYGWVYPFMEFEDLLFYLYPIALVFENNRELDCLDSFMYSLDRVLPTRKMLLTSEDTTALQDGLRWIWKTSNGDDYADWWQCPNLQLEIGVSVK